MSSRTAGLPAGAVFVVPGPLRRSRRRKPAAMRRFVGAWDIVQVWSRTEAEHAAALETYTKRGWEILHGPTQVARMPVPYRATVRRKLKARDDDR